MPKQIKVADITHRRLTDIARKDETYDYVINKCIDAYHELQKVKQDTTNKQRTKHD